MATLRALGRWDEAEQAADGLIVMRERHQGAGHPYALQARCDLALILHAAGKQLEASAAADDVVDVSVRALGPQHPVTARIRQDHATITGR
ncbi:tetratricopeptide repeat protein (plasmid) [Streptomyces sp. NBC_00637]|uniref:tetratricopeptide repeat protein n=1 Tax=Streptomyces sp. NBC_00637 TaxID=2903667 RepID=UPI00324CEBAB